MSTHHLSKTVRVYSG